MWVLENMLQAFAGMASAALTLFDNTIVEMFSFILLVNQTTYVTDFCTYISVVTVALVSVVALKRGLDTYVFETDGDPEQDPTEMIFRMAQTLAVIGSNAWIFNFMLKVSAAFANDVGKTNIQSVNEELQTLLNDTAYGTGEAFSDMVLAMAALSCILAIGEVVFYFSLGIRGAELTLMKMLCPVFALDLLTTSREKWRPFITDYIVNFLSFGIQLLCFKQMCLAVVTIRDGNAAAYAVIAIGWLFLAIRAPKWLEKYTYSSGIKQTASNGARGAMGLAYAIRMLR